MFTDSWFRNLEQRIPEDIRSDHGRVFRKKPEFDEGNKHKIRETIFRIWK